MNHNVEFVSEENRRIYGKGRLRTDIKPYKHQQEDGYTVMVETEKYNNNGPEPRNVYAFRPDEVRIGK